MTLNQLMDEIVEAEAANELAKLAALEAELKSRTENRFGRIMGLALEWAEENDGQAYLPVMEEKIKIVLADPACDDWEDEWVIEEVTEMLVKRLDSHLQYSPQLNFSISDAGRDLKRYSSYTFEEVLNFSKSLQEGSQRDTFLRLISEAVEAGHSSEAESYEPCAYMS